MSLLPLLLGLGLSIAMPAGGDAQTLVEEGERWWRESPDPDNPVACATCHHDPRTTRGWAASFPKFRPLPPPHGRVMTLLQANAEAVARHYRLRDPLAVATAITAYLAAHGAGVAPSPGIAAGQPVFPERIRALSASVARGARLYARRCAECHDAGLVAVRALGFPRRVGRRAEALETFIESHHPGQSGLAWDGDRTADLAAYLVSRLAGRLIVGGPGPAQEASR